MAKWPGPESDFEHAFNPKPTFDAEPDFEPLELKKPLARGKASDLGDVTGIADALADLGAYDKGRHGNPPLVPETLFRAIEDFQKDQGLDVDGVMLPNGPTLGRINALLPKARPRRVRGDFLQSERPIGNPPTAAPQIDDEAAWPRRDFRYDRRLTTDRHSEQSPEPDVRPGMVDRSFGRAGGSIRPSLDAASLVTDRLLTASTPGPTALMRDEVVGLSDEVLAYKLAAISAPSRERGEPSFKIDGTSTEDEDQIFAAWRGRIVERIRALAQAGVIASERAELLLVQFEGHHYFPQEIFNQLDLTPEARDAFRRGTTGLTERHVNDAAHRQYTAAVREMWQQWIRERGINPSQMTRAQAEEFLRAIRHSTNPTIRDFNNAIRFEQIRALLRGLRRR